MKQHVSIATFGYRTLIVVVVSKCLTKDAQRHIELFRQTIAQSIAAGPVIVVQHQHHIVCYDYLPLLVEPCLAKELLRSLCVVIVEHSYYIPTYCYHSVSPMTSMWKQRRSSSTTATFVTRSEEHTSELQSRQYLVCRL